MDENTSDRNGKGEVREALLRAVQQVREEVSSTTGDEAEPRQPLDTDASEQESSAASDTGRVTPAVELSDVPAARPAPAVDNLQPEGAVPVTDPEEPGTGEELPDLRAGLEAILLVVDEPVPEVTLAQILERPRDEVVAALRELSAEYTEQGRGFDLREIAGGWRFYTRDSCAPLVEKFVQDGQHARLTQAALETLAVVAYRQPVSRARVSAIRGVNSEGVIRTLTLRGLIEEAGHDPEHQATLYRTTGYFLERLGLRSLDELPDLAPYLPDDVEGIEEVRQ